MARLIHNKKRSTRRHSLHAQKELFRLLPLTTIAPAIHVVTISASRNAVNCCRRRQNGVGERKISRALRWLHFADAAQEMPTALTSTREAMT